VIHLRIVAPSDRAERAVELLKKAPAACNVVYLKGAAYDPEGDVILVDVAREAASVIVSDLRELEIHREGSIAIESSETHISEAVERAERRAPGAPSDAVVWEEVEARTSESSRLSSSFLIFMVLAALIAAAGIFLDSPILIVGAMVVGPEFGPIAGFCVAAVERRPKLAGASFLALAVGLPVAITAAWAAAEIFRLTGVTPDVFSEADHGLANIISSPDFFSLFVALCAGAAGVLSLSTAKSGALVGVLISVTTIPAAANIGVAFAYEDWESWRGSQAQLAINVVAILAAGTLTLWIQRRLYRRRRVEHLHDPAREVAGLPVGRSVSSAPPPATTRPRASSARDR
jgi:uncharacterized hydrophobic protein (TIGR00271 family)